MDPSPATDGRKLFIALAVILVLLVFTALFTEPEDMQCSMARMDPGVLAKLTPLERQRCAALLQRK